MYCTAAIPGLYGAEHAPGMLLWEVTGSSCEAISEVVFMCAYTGDTVCILHGNSWRLYIYCTMSGVKCQ